MPLRNLPAQPPFDRSAPASLPASKSLCANPILQTLFLAKQLPRGAAFLVLRQPLIVNDDSAQISALFVLLETLPLPTQNWTNQLSYERTIVAGLGYRRTLYNVPMLLGRRLRTAAALLTFALGVATASGQFTEVGTGAPGPVKAPHLTVALTALSPQISIGGNTTIGLVMQMDPHWHVYWINPGDVGEAPHIHWTLPSGISAGPLQFPAPQRLPLGPLMDFGYENQVAYPILLTASPSTKPGKIHLDAHITWLVCSAQCIPGKAHLGLDLDALSNPVPTPQLTGVLGQSIQNLPKPLPSSMSLTAIGGAQQIALTLKTSNSVKDLQFFPFDNGIIDNAAPQPVDTQSDNTRIWLTRYSDKPNSISPLPKSIHGILKLSNTESYDVTVPITPGTLAFHARSTATNAPIPSQPGSITLFTAIGLAFFGGIILNLMPCVFPVLFLKGLALVHSTNEERSHQRAHGLIYTLGILVSFWIIVAALLILRATGKELGWGFQLQSPAFVAILAALIFFLALSLAGQFEIGLSLTSAGGGLAKKQGFAGSFFTGVLATVVATPCMAPLMGAAVGFALAQPSWLTFLVFTFLALGLALPYLLLSMNPQWTKILPKPGAWMEVLKQLTSVPLFATAIWLTWVYAHLYTTDGVDRMAALLCCYLLLAIAGWFLGRWPARWGSAIIAILLIALAVYLPLRKPTVETLTWKPYSTSSLEAARATGHPVFIDFTAAWCLSCQVNERAVLESKDVDAALLSGHFELLKADWTQYDPQITEELGNLHRSGVPTYVIYPAGTNSQPDVLPELLTKDNVLEAIHRDQAKH
jgi:thiol:disulfide interchange protein/DsbC/DsbD-like thiol-disulfide interchange protein